jgi:hypothetical protein
MASWREAAKQLLGTERVQVLRRCYAGIQSSWPVALGRQLWTDAALFLNLPVNPWYEEVLSFGPHPPGLYDYILERLLSGGGVEVVLAMDLHAGMSPGGQGSLVLRHDLDAQPEKLRIFTEAERRLRVRSSIYVRVDGASYDSQEIAGQLRRLRDEGFEIGLHTAVYQAPEPLAALERELGHFRTILGFEALSLNTHGVFPSSRSLGARRQEFLRELSRRAAEMNLVVVDHNLPGSYDLLVGDANLAMNRHLSYISREVFKLAHLVNGNRGLLMTHPEYWLE